MGLRQRLYKEAQRDVALITHRLFEDGLVAVSEETKADAKKLVADIIHDSRRRLEKEFCKEGQGAQPNGRRTKRTQ